MPSLKRAVIVAAGELDLTDPAWLNAVCASSDLVVAADGGLRHCRAAAVSVDVLIGDLDSVAPDMVEQAKLDGTEVKAFDQDKDATDLELALEYAYSEGVTAAVVAGAVGGRIDHTLAALNLLASSKYGLIEICVRDAAVLAHVVHPGRSPGFSFPPGSTVSILPIGGSAKGVTATGFKWPLNGDDLPVSSTIGVSNVAVSPRQTVSIDEGVLLVVADCSQRETLHDAVIGR